MEMDRRRLFKLLLLRLQFAKASRSMAEAGFSCIPRVSRIFQFPLISRQVPVAHSLKNVVTGGVMSNRYVHSGRVCGVSLAASQSSLWCW
jgi:hypothetical protein